MDVYYQLKEYRIGTLAAVETDGAVSGLFFVTVLDSGRGTDSIRLDGKRYSLASEAKNESTPLLAEMFRQLDGYFAGERRTFDLPLILNGTEFQRRVWEELRTIPYGGTAAYGEIARRVGKPKGARAIGQAVNRNPIGIIVPCHRVIGSNGEMTGFAPGVEKKVKLLEWERKIQNAVSPK